MKKRWDMFFLIVFFLILGVIVSENKSKAVLSEEYRLDELQEAFDEITKGETGFSIKDYLTEVIDGKRSFSVDEIAEGVFQMLEEQWEGQKGQLIRLFLLGILAGVFSNFSDALGRRELGETGFFVVYLLLFSIITVSFFEIAGVAAEVMENLLLFMKVLIPAFSISVAVSSGSASSAGFYELTIAGMTLVESILVNILLPGVSVYFLLTLANQLTREGRFSKMAELIHSFLRFTVKTIFGVILSLQGIQMLILPVLDKVKQNAVTKTASSLPGVGNVLGSVTETVLGTTMLIKSVIGIGGVIGICLVCVLPLLKIFVFMLTYRVSAAFVQPITDRRIVRSLNAAAESGKLLLSIVALSSLLFLFSIAIVMGATNS